MNFLGPLSQEDLWGATAASLKNPVPQHGRGLMEVVSWVFCVTTGSYITNESSLHTMCFLGTPPERGFWSLQVPWISCIIHFLRVSWAKPFLYGHEGILQSGRNSYTTNVLYKMTTLHLHPLKLVCRYLPEHPFQRSLLRMRARRWRECFPVHPAEKTREELQSRPSSLHCVCSLTLQRHSLSNGPARRGH